MWSTFEYVLTGNETVLIPFARQMAATLSKITTHGCCWHLVFIDILQGDPERTFRCDPGYDLDAVAGQNAIAWVTPYAGADWTESGKYPTVTFH